MCCGRFSNPPDIWEIICAYANQRLVSQLSQFSFWPKLYLTNKLLKCPYGSIFAGTFFTCDLGVKAYFGQLFTQFLHSYKICVSFNEKLNRTGRYDGRYKTWRQTQTSGRALHFCGEGLIDIKYVTVLSRGATWATFVFSAHILCSMLKLSYKSNTQLLCTDCTWMS